MFVPSRTKLPINSILKFWRIKIDGWPKKNYKNQPIFIVSRYPTQKSRAGGMSWFCSKLYVQEEQFVLCETQLFYLGSQWSCGRWAQSPLLIPRSREVLSQLRFIRPHWPIPRRAPVCCSAAEKFRRKVTRKFDTRLVLNTEISVVCKLRRQGEESFFRLTTYSR